MLTDFKMKETKGTRFIVHHTQPLSEMAGGSAQTQVQITSVSRGTSKCIQGDAQPEGEGGGALGDMGEAERGPWRRTKPSSPAACSLTALKMDVAPHDYMCPSYWGVTWGSLVKSSLNLWSPRKSLAHLGIKKIMMMMKEGINE